MKKKLYAILTTFIMSLSYLDAAWASEIIKIYSPYSAGHSGTPAFRRIIEEANSLQNIYTFVLEFKPGGLQAIAVKSIDPENGLAIIAPAYVENINSGVLERNNYVPVHALGNACWAVVANKSLTGAREFVVGGVGYGNAAHLTSLSLGDKYGFDVRYIVFKSNYDALVNMTGNNGVELVIDKYEAYDALRTKNNKIHMVASSCPTRLPQAPNVKTLKELGIEAPLIFNITIAHKDMPVARRQAISTILDTATKKIGAVEIYRLSAMKPPIFNGITNKDFYDNSITTIEKLQDKYKNQIEQSKK